MNPSPETEHNPNGKQQGLSPQGPSSVARFRLARPGRPRITRLLSFTAKVHQALCALSDLGEGPSPAFTGRDEGGQPFREHEHAYLFCETEGLNDTITHLSVWKSTPFDMQATIAIGRLQRVWGHEVTDTELQLEAIGEASAIAQKAFLGSFREWTSHTPFVSSRFAKTHHDGRPKIDPGNGWPVGSGPHELLRLLSLEPRFAGAAVRVVPGARPFRFGRSSHSAHAFVTDRGPRGKGGNKGETIGQALAIRFPQPVAGPIALGYGAHFGLGLFRGVKAGGDDLLSSTIIDQIAPKQ